MSCHVSVKFKYGKGNPTTLANWSGNVEGKTESAVLNALRKLHSGYNIVIVDIRWI